MDGNVIIREHLYLTEGRDRVVQEGDPAGRWLWASPGTEVALRDAVRLGAVKVEPEVEAAELESTQDPAEDAKPETKARKQVPNKARAKGEDK